MKKYLIATIMFFGAAALVLFVMNRNLSEKNAALQQALAQQNALLEETQAELEKRDAVISQRDAQLEELQNRTAKAEDKYAKLIRSSKVVRDWDVVLLPDDVLGLLKTRGADSAAGPTCDTDGSGGNP
jgi:lipid II:glycine glycyltransferase (peptidoglycan interpeptide bridge formation enzyme)